MGEAGGGNGAGAAAGGGQSGRAGHAGQSGSGTGGQGGSDLPPSFEWEPVCVGSSCLAFAPVARQAAAGAFDAVRNEVVIYGGETFENTVLAETWAWNGSAWTQHCADNACNSALGPRYGAAAVFDPARESVVIFGGLNGPSVQSCQNGTFAWDGASWAALAPENPPSGRYSPGMAYDSARGVIVLFGGSCENVPLGGTFELGADWREACIGDCAATAPSARSGIAMAYDAARGLTVLFGGSTASGPSDETFLWNGTTWSAANPSTRPEPRIGARMVYDSRRERSVLFGGTNSTEAFADLWEWDGVDWRKLAPFHEVQPRHRATLVFDSDRNRVVLFGGASDPSTDPQTYLNDTWELIVE